MPHFSTVDADTGLFVENGPRENAAVRRDRLHDQIVIARLQVDRRLAPDAACFARAIDDPQHNSARRSLSSAVMSALALRAPSASPRASAALPSDKTCSARFFAASALASRADLRVVGLKSFWQDVPDLLLRLGFRNFSRTGDGEIMKQDGRQDDGQDPQRDLADPAAVDPGKRKAARKTGFWRLVGEALLSQSLDAFFENVIGNLDPLSLVNLAQPFDQRLVAVAERKLALDEALIVAQRIDDIHRQHEVVELRRRALEATLSWNLRHRRR